MADLDPKLQALQGRLDAAISDGSLDFNATTLGDDGSAIISLFQSALDTDVVTVSGSVATSVSGDYLLVSADALQTAILSIEQQTTKTYFGVSGDKFSIQIQSDAGTDWTFASSFPLLSGSWAGLFQYDTTSSDSNQAILASENGPLIGNSLTVTAGTNLKSSILLTSGPAQAITSLVTGIGSPLTAIGAAKSETTFESVAAIASIPDFSVTLPVLGDLSFDSSQAGFAALLGSESGGNLYSAYFQASSHVGLGGVSLPLMMRVPYTVGGSWTFGTIPGQSVPVSDLTAFFATLTGLDFLSQLPDVIQPLTKFELSDFSIKLNNDFSDYSYLGLRFGTPVIDAEDNSWTIIQGTGSTPILQLTQLGLDLEINRYNSSNTYRGQLTGSVSLSQTLVLQAIIPFPVSTSLWRFSAFSQQALPNLVDFANFIGDRSLADLLPNKLGELTSFNLDFLLLTYSPSDSSFKNFSIAMSSAQPWVIVDDWLTIDAIGFNMSLNNPLSASSALTGQVQGLITLGSSTHINVQITKDTPTSSWILTVFTDSISLPSIADLTTLANGDISPLLPEQLQSNHFVLSDILIEADISNAKMQSFGFSLSSTDTWTIITDILDITAVGVVLDLTWSEEQRQTQGKIWGNVSFCEADFYLEAAYSNSNWQLGINLMEGSQLTLENLTKAFDPALWTSLQNLHVPNIALTEASIAYNTGSSDYSFVGTVGPADGDKWQIDVGISNINIESLGGKVTCTREAEGSAGNKKIYVTGKFSIGSVEFDISYEAGANLTIDCTLVGTTPILVLDMLSNLCDPDASNITWTSGFDALDSMIISDAHAALVLGDKPSFEIYGKITIEGVVIDCLFVVVEINSKWEFAFAIRIDVDWSLSGFTNVFDVFNIDSSTWMITASSFTDTGFAFPVAFPTPSMATIERGLDFYATFSTGNTLSTISTVIQALPADSIETEYTVHGLLADPLADSYLEVIISSSPEGVPLFGMQEVKLQSFSLRMKATPAFGLHGVFLFDSVKNSDGSALSSGISVDFMISTSDVTLEFGPPPGQNYIFNWQDAFGITELDIELDHVGFTFAWEPTIGIGGDIGGQVEFEHSENPTNSLFKNAIPHPASVAYMEERKLMLMQTTGHPCTDDLGGVDYNRPYDQDGILIALDTSFIVLMAAEIPVPYPKKLAGHIVNFTLPYLLDRFADIQLPDVLMPIQFPDVCFYLELPDPEHIGVGSNLVFDFAGKLIIFGLHGEVAAHFDATRVMFSASMDPVLIPADGSLVSITAEGDKTKGVELSIDTSPPQGENNIYGTFALDFFGVDLQGDISLESATDPINTKFKFHVQGQVGSLADMNLTFIYRQLSYLYASGSFNLNLTTDGLSGFTMSKNGKTFTVADSIDLSKASATGLLVSANIELTLDATNPADPDFKLTGSADATLNISEHCHLPLHLALDIDVNKDTFSQLPLTLAEQMVDNGASVFGGLLSSVPGCFTDLLNLGVFVLSETSKVATVLVEGFGMGVQVIDAGAKLLKDVGSAAESVADSLWSIFGSKSSKNNTKAMKHGGYHAVETGDAIKKTQDKEEPSTPYTGSDLVHDQASADYAADHVVGALCSAFTDYGSQPLQAGQLLANLQLTSYTATNVAMALHTQYSSDTNTTAKMVNLLNQIYAGSSALGPQEMADALAPLYPANEVAQQLRQHYPSATDTAVKMAALLVSAYGKDGNPLTVGSLAGALAPLYTATPVAAVLHTDFPTLTDTPTKLGTVLKTAYSGTATLLTATTLATALAPIFTTPSDIVSALQLLYASDTDTAAKMAVILMAVYPSMTVADMAAALTVGQYPVQDIAAVLKQYYGTEAGTPQQMTTLLAAQSYTPAQVAPVLVALWPTECDTAEKVATILLAGFSAGSINVNDMAAALKTAAFTAVEVAPALRENYASDTSTASDMATILINAYEEGGDNEISADTMAKALKATSYAANTAAGTAQALMTNYAADTSTALEMSKLLAAAPYTAAEIAPALIEFYSASVDSATTLAGVLAGTPFSASISAAVIKTSFPSDVTSADDMYAVLVGAWTTPVLTATQMGDALAKSTYAIDSVASVLKTHYAPDTTQASDMYGLLQAAYTNPAPTIAAMAGALATAPYQAVEVAPLLKTNYPSEAGTATLLCPIVKAAYASISLNDMMAALAASSFNALDIATPSKTAFTEATVENMGQGLVAAYTGTAALTALSLGVALLTASYSSGDIAKGVKAGLDTTSAGLMAAVLLTVSDDKLASSISSAQGFRGAGDSLPTAAPKVVAAVSGISGATLAGALGSVFMPPTSTISQLLNGIVAAFATPDANNIAEGCLTFQAATTDAQLLTDLKAAYTAAGKTIPDDAALAAVMAAFAYIGAPIGQGNFGELYISLNTSATPNDVAGAIDSAYGSEATATTLVSALPAAFQGGSTLVDARVTAMAVTTALQFGETDADKMLSPLADGFSLTHCPNDVGAVGVALQTSNYSLNSVSAAMSGYWGSDWTPAAYQILASIYSNPAWATAITQRTSGAVITAAAPAIYNAHTDTDCALMVEILAAVYDLTVTADAIDPMANALKLVVSGGDKVYTLNEASAAMSAQYSPDWTPADWQQFQTIFNG